MERLHVVQLSSMIHITGENTNTRNVPRYADNECVHCYYLICTNVQYKYAVLAVIVCTWAWMQVRMFLAKQMVKLCNMQQQIQAYENI